MKTKRQTDDPSITNSEIDLFLLGSTDRAEAIESSMLSNPEFALRVADRIGFLQATQAAAEQCADQTVDIFQFPGLDNEIVEREPNWRALAACVFVAVAVCFTLSIMPLAPKPAWQPLQLADTSSPLQELVAERWIAMQDDIDTANNPADWDSLTEEASFQVMEDDWMADAVWQATLEGEV